ncbi:MAG: hypothetical protein QNJ69_13680 [Gammaproteobacteria bacterium]|nr:hypothetical protein [Gammaproteobacteria bacterium]
MPEHQDQQHIDDVVEHKVRRRVAKKVIADVHQQAQQIEQDQQLENRAKNLLIPGLMLVLAIIIMLLVWPDFMRWLSGIID